MAELNVQPKKKSYAWVWIMLILIIIAGGVYWYMNYYNKDATLIPENNNSLVVQPGRMVVA